MVTGPMPRKPNATRPNENTAGAFMISSTPVVLTPKAMAIRPAMTIPIQYELKLPAVRPDRMFSDGPPSRDAVTTSLTCLDWVEVKILTTSGMIAPASVPQVMMSDSFHHRLSLAPPAPSRGTSRYDTMKVIATDTIDVTQTSWVSGCSKCILSALPERALTIASLNRYESPLATIIMMRIAKSQTSNCTCTSASGTASRMKVISATPVTP